MIGCLLVAVAGAVAYKYRMKERLQTWYAMPPNKRLVADVGDAGTCVFITMRE